MPKPAALGAQTLEKGLQVLEYMVENKSTTVTGLSKRLGLQKSASYRFLNTLRMLGYIEQDENSTYHLTDKLEKMGKGIVPQLEIRRLASPHLGALTRLTGLSSNLALWNDKDIVYIEQSKHNHIAKFSVGETVPAYCTALGKAILAHLPEEEVADYIKKTKFTAFTDKTTSSPAQLLADLRLVRERGYATMQDELMPHLRGVAVPVLLHGAAARYAVSVAGLYYDTVETLVEKTLVLLLETAKTLSVYLESSR